MKKSRFQNRMSSITPYLPGRKKLSKTYICSA